MTKDFSREYKYTIGQDLKNTATQMILNIYRANSVYDKKNNIRQAREDLEVIRLYFRLLKDLKQISIKKIVYANELIESISKQLLRWEKSSLK